MDFLPAWFFPQWVDSLWLLIALIIAGRKQKILSFAFILSCMAMMRLQVEMLGSMGFPHGVLSILPYHIFWRGLVVYSIIYALYFLFIKVSPGSKGSLLLASALTLFFGGFFISSFIMIL